MEYLVTGRQAKAIDTYTIEHTGIPSLVPYGTGFPDHC